MKIYLRVCTHGMIKKNRIKHTTLTTVTLRMVPGEKKNEHWVLIESCMWSVKRRITDSCCWDTSWKRRMTIYTDRYIVVWCNLWLLHCSIDLMERVWHWQLMELEYCEPQWFEQLVEQSSYDTLWISFDGVIVGTRTVYENNNAKKSEITSVFEQVLRKWRKAVVYFN